MGCLISLFRYGTFWPNAPANDLQRKRRNDTGRFSKSGGLRQLSDHEQAATKIQAGFRGYKTRKNMKLVRMLSTDEQDAKILKPALSTIKEEEEAATKIQAGVRGYLLRKKMKQSMDMGQSQSDDIEESVDELNSCISDVIHPPFTSDQRGRQHEDAKPTQDSEMTGKIEPASDPKSTAENAQTGGCDAGLSARNDESLHRIDGDEGYSLIQGSTSKTDGSDIKEIAKSDFGEKPVMPITQSIKPEIDTELKSQASPGNQSSIPEPISKNAVSGDLKSGHSESSIQETDVKEPESLDSQALPSSSSEELEKVKLGSQIESTPHVQSETEKIKFEKPLDSGDPSLAVIKSGLDPKPETVETEVVSDAPQLELIVERTGINAPSTEPSAPQIDSAHQDAPSESLIHTPQLKSVTEETKAEAREASEIVSPFLLPESTLTDAPPKTLPQEVAVASPVLKTATKEAKVEAETVADAPSFSPHPNSKQVGTEPEVQPGVSLIDASQFNPATEEKNVSAQKNTHTPLFSSTSNNAQMIAESVNHSPASAIDIPELITASKETRVETPNDSEPLPFSSATKPALIDTETRSAQPQSLLESSELKSPTEEIKDNAHEVSEPLSSPKSTLIDTSKILPHEAVNEIPELKPATEKTSVEVPEFSKALSLLPKSTLIDIESKNAHPEPPIEPHSLKPTPEETKVEAKSSPLTRNLNEEQQIMLQNVSLSESPQFKGTTQKPESEGKELSDLSQESPLTGLENSSINALPKLEKTDLEKEITQNKPVIQDTAEFEERDFMEKNSSSLSQTELPLDTNLTELNKIEASIEKKSSDIEHNSVEEMSMEIKEDLEALFADAVDSLEHRQTIEIGEEDGIIANSPEPTTAIASATFTKAEHNSDHKIKGILEIAGESDNNQQTGVADTNLSQEQVNLPPSQVPPVNESEKSVKNLANEPALENEPAEPENPVRRRSSKRKRVAGSEKYRSGVVFDDLEGSDSTENTDALQQLKELDAEIESEAETLNNAATKIQAGFRGYQVRRGLNNAATKIQSNYRGYKTRKELRDRAHAATKIQATVRGYLTRKTILRNKTQEQRRKDIVRRRSSASHPKNKSSST